MIRKPGGKEVERNGGNWGERDEGASFVSLFFGIQDERVNEDVHDIPISIDP